MIGEPGAIGQKLNEICDLLNIESGDFREMADILSDTEIAANPRLASELEHVLRPAKILKCGIPNYIVPIRPKWAVDLFDSGLAEEMLWAGDPALAMNTESVYYRSARPNIFKGFGRILWYVSQDRRNGSKRIRACSRVTEISVATAKPLYRQFRRLGVYRWEDVVVTVDGDQNRNLMAIRFDDTERLLRSLMWKEFQPVLRRHGIKSNIQSPVGISEEVFVELYAGSNRPA
jgi:hypothetical protein